MAVLRRIVTVHPHACGENGGLTFMVGEQTGSPPRVWGKPRRLVMAFTLVRFTPTRVGKTGARTAYRAGDSVHPHACGENRLS